MYYDIVCSSRNRYFALAKKQLLLRQHTQPLGADEIFPIVCSRGARIAKAVTEVRIERLLLFCAPRHRDGVWEKAEDTLCGSRRDGILILTAKRLSLMVHMRTQYAKRVIIYMFTRVLLWGSLAHPDVACCIQFWGKSFNYYSYTTQLNSIKLFWLLNVYSNQETVMCKWIKNKFA